MSSYLNLSPKDLDVNVYRVIPLTRLYELFETRTNVLVSPKKWEDPFEKIVLRGLFGQCWTRHKASDAMWRIYSPQSEGVRLRTTVRALLSGLSKSLPHPARAFIGGVGYPRSWSPLRGVLRKPGRNRVGRLNKRHPGLRANERPAGDSAHCLPAST
jgi:hypothetical protein